MRARIRDLVASATVLAVPAVLMIAVTPAVAAAATDTPRSRGHPHRRSGARVDRRHFLYGGNGAVWNSNYVLQPGDQLTLGEQLSSLSERYRLIMQSDGPRPLPHRQQPAVEQLELG